MDKWKKITTQESLSKLRVIKAADLERTKTKIPLYTSHLLRVGCISFFIFMITVQFKKYNLNEDASVMNVRKFAGVDWKDFPAITLCFQSGEYPLLDGLYNKSSIESELQVSASEYRDILLGNRAYNDMDKIVGFDFERNTMNLRNYLKKFRVQDTNENEYVWKYDEAVENPTFEYVVNQPFGWNKREKLARNDVPLVPSYLDPKIKCFSHHPELDEGITVDSIDFYFYISKLASIEGGKVYIYVHQDQQLIRNLRYLYKIRHFIGVSRRCSNNQLVFDLMYVRIVKNREDARDACNKSLNSDDQEWMKQVILNVSCIPSYWISVHPNQDNVSLCHSKKQFKAVSRHLAFKNAYGRNMMLNKYYPPCDGMRVLANTNTDKYDKDDLLKIKFRFR